MTSVVFYLGIMIGCVVGCVVAYLYGIALALIVFSYLAAGMSLVFAVRMMREMARIKAERWPRRSMPDNTV